MTHLRALNVIVLGIGGETQPIKPGDVEFIPAGVPRERSQGQHYLAQYPIRYDL